jgi:hypothetical protein
LEPTVSGGDDGIGIGFPGEWFRVVGIVFADEAVDGGLEIDDGTEDAVLEPAGPVLGPLRSITGVRVLASTYGRGEDAVCRCVVP